MENILPQIEKMIEQTRNGKIKWVSPNANTFRWTKEIEPGKVVTMTLQNAMIVTAARQDKRFIFTINAPPEMTIQINTQLQREYIPALEQLFLAAVESSRGAASDFLDKLLGNL